MSDIDRGTGRGPAAAEPLSRRALLVGSGAALSLLLAGSTGNDPTSRRRRPHQRGVVLPDHTHRQARVAAHPLDAAARSAPSAAASVLTALGAAADRLMLQAGAARSEMTITIGVGPAVVSAAGANLPGAADLPTFAGDDAIPDHRRSADVHLVLQGDDPAQLADAHAQLGRLIGTAPSWTAHGTRPHVPARNPFGFRDEISNPSGTEGSGIWLTEGPLAGATIGVVRVLDLDVEGFTALPAAEQAATVGRQPDGTPLSGRSPTDPVDLLAREPEGGWTVPVGAHVRAARSPYSNPGVMLRRSYDLVPDDDARTSTGMIFCAYQRSLSTFVSTQHRLDREDHLMRFVTVAASGTFLVPPRARRGRPFGSFLLG